MKSIDFTLGARTEAYFACTAVFGGQAIVVGGKTEYNQVSYQIIMFNRLKIHAFNSSAWWNLVD